MTWAAVAVGGYLLGSLSFARIVGRVVLPGVSLDNTEYGDEGSSARWVYRGVSATSVGERAGGGWGFIVTALDIMKALIPVLVARLVWPDRGFELVLAIAIVTGHIWPVWHRFRGGRGQSPILGALLAIDIVAIPASILIAVAIGLVVFTSVFLAREGFALWLPLWFLPAAGWSPKLVFAVAASALYAIALWPDIRQDFRVERLAGRRNAAWSTRVRSAAKRVIGADDPT